MATIFKPTALSVALALAACTGGGGQIVPIQQPAQSAVTMPPFNAQAPDKGTSFDGQPRQKVLSAVQARFKLDIQFSSTAIGSERVAPTVKPLAVRVAPPDRVMLPSQIFAQAEANFPTLFAPAHGSIGRGTYQGEEYDFWWYATGNVLGIRTVNSPNDPGGVYVLFAGTSETVRYETAAFWSCVFEPTRCGPRLVGAKLVNFAGETLVDLLAANSPAVSAKAARLVLTYNETLACGGVSGTGLIGSLFLTTVCEGRELTFTPGQTGEERWPLGTVNTLTVGGLRNADGYPSATETVTFTTKLPQVAESKVFVTSFGANGDPGSPNHGPAVTAIEGLMVQGAHFPGLPTSPNWASLQRMTISPSAGVVYVGGGGLALYRLDLETGAVLTPINLGLPEAPWHMVQGLALTGAGEVCAAMGRLDFSAYSARNVLTCWNESSHGQSFQSPVDYLAGSDMVVMDLITVPERKRLYAIAAEANAYTLISDDRGQLKQEFAPGSKGLVVEVDAETKAITRTFPVGAGPRSVVYDKARERLIVANSGDRTLSIIDLETGNVVTQSLPGFTGYQRPQSLVIARGVLWVSDYVSALVMLDLETLAEVRRVDIGLHYLVFFTEASGTLVVPHPRSRVGEAGLTRVDLGTFGVTTQVLTGSRLPWYVRAYSSPEE